MEEIRQWLNSDRPYSAGVEIFAKYHNNKVLVRTFLRGGEKRYHAKLVYEMGKLVKQPIVKKAVKSTKTTLEPAIITAAKAEIRVLKAEIAQLHERLYETGTGNDKEVCAKRAAILLKRKPLILRYDLLYELKEEYFRTWEIPERLTAEMQKPAKSVIAPNKSEEALNKLSNDDLLRKIHSLASSISRAQNVLNYQSFTKLPERRPLPAGIKRDRWERKLKQLKTQYKKALKIKKDRGL